jgi:hypothetical protein
VFKVPRTLYGVVAFDMLQKRIKCFDANHKKIILKPDQTEEICFDYKGEKIRMLSRPFDTNFDILSGSKSFLRILIDGKLKLLKYYRNGGAAGLLEKYVMQKGNEKLFKVSILSFKQDMTTYLSDCPSVSKKIEEKVYKKDDVEQIVDEYNKICK